MTVNDFTLQSTIERNKKFYLERFGQWTNEGLMCALQDYHSCKGSIEAFTDDDWKAAEENGLTREEIVGFCESEDD